MTIARTLGRMLDHLTTDGGALRGFSRLPNAGHEVRRFFAETAFAQREVVFYRDKWWTAEGGTLNLEVMVLAPEVQLALAGRPQSLASPDSAVPFIGFQYGLTVGATPTWAIASAEDARGAADQAAEWLRTEGLPWMDSIDSMDGVIALLERTRGHQRLARLHAARGDGDAARRALAAWLRTLPRQADRALAELHDAGVLAAGDLPVLRTASLQREDVYAAEVESWLSGADHAPAPG